MVERRYPQHLVLIHAAVSDKLEFTDGRRTDGRTTDACAMTVALLTKSSRAKKQFVGSDKIDPLDTRTKL